MRLPPAATAATFIRQASKVNEAGSLDLPDPARMNDLPRARHG